MLRPANERGSNDLLLAIPPDWNISSSCVSHSSADTLFLLLPAERCWFNDQMVGKVILCRTQWWVRVKVSSL